jgi:replicative DNA helicase
VRGAERVDLEGAIVLAILDQGDGFLDQRPAEASWCFANVEPEVFASPTARSIYGAARGLAAQGRPWGAISVWNALDAQDGTGDAAMRALFELTGYTEALPSWTIRDGVATLLRLAHRADLRLWHELGLEAAAPEMLDPAPERRVEPFAKEVSPGILLLDHLDRALKRDGNVPTGIAPLDALLAGGIRPGEMFVIGARTGTGKTALACQIALNAFLAGKRFAYFSVEMSAGQILERMSMSFGNDEVFIPRIHNSTIRVYDNLFTPEKVAHTAAKDGPFDLIVVDHLSIMKCPSAAKQGRVQEVSAITREIKLLATSLKVPIIAACQLNRQVAGRDDGRPRLSDLRDSGSIEQDADQVLLLHDAWRAWRELDDAKRKKVSEPERKKLDGLLAKNRRGETGVASFCFERNHQRIAAWGGDSAHYL